MILQPKETTVAYRCPHCGTTVISVVGVLALSGDFIRLKCQCGNSELTITNTEDKKLRLTVPCVFCPTPHNYLISRSTVLSRSLFTFPCSYAGIDICFIGTKGEVLKALEQSDEQIKDLVGEDDLEDIRDAHAGAEYGDEHLRDLVVFVLGELSDEGKIICDCHDGGDFLCEQLRDRVVVSCKKCGAKKEIFCTGSLDAAALLDCDVLYLNK